MQIDPLQQQALVGSQEAARAAQLANLEYARTQWEREQKLYEAGVVAKQEYDQAKTNVDTAEQQLKALDQQLQAQQVLLHYYKVVAPTDGIIGDIPVRVLCDDFHIANNHRRPWRASTVYKRAGRAIPGPEARANRADYL